MALSDRLTRLPVVRDVARAREDAEWQRATGYVMKHRPGHYGSPIPALKEIKERESEIFVCPESIPGIDTRDREQLELVRQFVPFHADQPFAEGPRDGLRYRLGNKWFSHSDGLMLHWMLRWQRPHRLIEIGSGFSSALVLDTNDRFLDGTLSCTFIEPFPDRRLNGLLHGDDANRHRVLPLPVQRVPLETFDELDDGDILFVDSSHVAKIGSDLNRIVFDVLPRLRPGVLVHFHDIQWPFEYSRAWVYGGRAFNEAYLLRAFLMFNANFEIVLFNDYLERFHNDEVTARLPLWGAHAGGCSLWLRRT